MDEDLFPIWREPRSFWERTGLTERQQRVLDGVLAGTLFLLVLGWIYTTVVALRRGEGPTLTRQMSAAASPLSRQAPAGTTFALNALLERFIDWEEVRGASGAVRIILQEAGDTLIIPDAVPPEAVIGYVPADAADTAAAAVATDGAPLQPGIWNLLLQVGDAVRGVPQVSVATMVPLTALRGGRIGEYRIGEWPRRTGAYAPPSGFVQVTPENMNTPVSEHFALRDFLTKGQEGVWPKYVVLSPRLLDKLELTIQELEARGHPVNDLFVISGFRTPWYNATGGTTGGRGAMSRHMYGDAADIAIDNDGDACMDDLNGDGRVDVADARIVAAAAEQVELRHPDLVGGIGIYPPSPGSHCGFVHIDTRGSRARW